jgi:hypothetical protein
MAFAVRDLMMDVFPVGDYRFEMRGCTLTSPTTGDDEEEEPCEAPSCAGSAEPPEEPEGEPGEHHGLATLRRQLREALAAASPAAPFPPGSVVPDQLPAGPSGEHGAGLAN